LTVIEISTDLDAIKQEYKDYVSDPDDVHIIAGAAEADADFLITYNTKHYLVDKIKAELDIIVHTAAQFLQYLRSLG